MAIENDKSPSSEDDFESFRKQRLRKLSQLSNYHNDYNVNKFMEDLARYFDNEIDFNLAKIRETISKNKKLDQLKAKADLRSTHPVIEFTEELFLDLGTSGKEKWE
jgi:hypothetical protein